MKEYKYRVDARLAWTNERLYATKTDWSNKSSDSFAMEYDEACDVVETALKKLGTELSNITIIRVEE